MLRKCTPLPGALTPAPAKQNALKYFPKSLSKSMAIHAIGSQFVKLLMTNLYQQFFLTASSGIISRSYHEQLWFSTSFQLNTGTFFNIGSRPLFLKWNDQNNLPIKQAATIAMTIMHTKNRIGTCTEYNIITIEEKRPETLRRRRGSNLGPCAPHYIASDSSVLHSLPADSAPW